MKVLEMFREFVNKANVVDLALAAAPAPGARLVAPRRRPGVRRLFFR